MWNTPVLVLTLLINVTNCVKLLSEGIDGININESRCVDHCLNTTSYYDCMGTCSSSWLFGGNDGASSCEEPNYNDANGTTCNPPSATFEIKTIFRRSLSGAVKEYFYFSWNPCLAAIDRLRGYWITLTFSNDIAAEKCYYLHLQKNNTPFQFSHTERDVRMWFVPPDPLDGEKFYDVRIKSIPYSKNEGMLELRSKKTADCPTLNGRHSCFCEYDILDPPNLTVLGYSLKVVFYPAPKCLSPEDYVLILCQTDGIFCVNNGFKDTIRKSQPQNDSNPIEYHFKNVFDSTTKNLTFKLHLVYEHDKGPKSIYRYITIKAWSPPQPIINDRGSGEFEARFSLPPTNFLLPAYMFRISRCDRINSSVIIGSVLKNYTVDSSSAEDGVLSQRFDLNEGVYCIQISEFRTKDITKYFDEAKWGPIKTIEVKALGSNLYAIVIVAASLTFMALSIIIFVSLLRAGKCGKFREYIPVVMTELIDPRKPLRQKTVFLVWQRDFRSQLLDDLYKEVIRSFGSFLAVECGLEVILDQCEEINMSTSYAQWISKSEARADTVLFICPHFDYSKYDEKYPANIGNFTRAFSYMEKDIFKDHRKYIFAVFPFANLKLNAHTTFLLRMTTLYNIMKEIEDLYFHIQGITKRSLFVRMSAGNISESLYRKTEVGRDLHKRLVEFDTELKKFNATRHSPSNSSDDVSCSSTGSSNHQDPPASQDVNPVPDKRSGDALFVGTQSSPLMVRSLSNVVPPQQIAFPVPILRSTPEPIVPFGNNPMQAIQQLNELSESSFFMSQCDSSFTSPSSCDYRNRFYGQRNFRSSSLQSLDYSRVLDPSFFRTNELCSVSASS